MIQTHLETEGDDAELVAVLRENEEVMYGSTLPYHLFLPGDHRLLFKRASQQERISMLLFVLRERGITGIEHYSLSTPDSSVTQPTRMQSSQLTFDNDISEDGGIDL